jgi:hypothetical protein
VYLDGGRNNIRKIDNNGLISINKTEQAEANSDIAGSFSISGLIIFGSLFGTTAALQCSPIKSNHGLYYSRIYATGRASYFHQNLPSDGVCLHGSSDVLIGTGSGG